MAKIGVLFKFLTFPSPICKSWKIYTHDSCPNHLPWMIYWICVLLPSVFIWTGAQQLEIKGITIRDVRGSSRPRLHTKTCIHSSLKLSKTDSISAKYLNYWRKKWENWNQKFWFWYESVCSKWILLFSSKTLNGLL